MITTLSAGTALVFFVIALGALAAGADRIVAFGVVAGLTAQAVAILAHVSERRNG